MINIIHLNFSTRGGAGNAAIAISKMLDKEKYRSEFFYVVEGDLKNNIKKQLKLVVSSFFDNYVVKYKKTKGLNSLTRGNLSNTKMVQKLIQVDESNSILHLHWVTGILDLSDLILLTKKFKKIFWTMHDFRVISGSCHSPFGCMNFQENCDGCPQVKPIFRNKVLQNKIKINNFFIKHNNIQLIIPTIRMREDLQASIFLKNISLVYVPNLVNINFYNYIVKQKEFYEKYNVPNNCYLITIIAENLSDPVKNIKVLKDIRNNLDSNSNFNYKFLLIGRHGSHFVGSNILYLGELSSIELQEIFSISHLNLSLSTFETFGNTIIEAGLSGIESIVYFKTYSSEILENTASGRFWYTPSDLSVTIINFLSNYQNLRNEIHNSFMNLYGYETIKKIYNTIYNL